MIYILSPYSHTSSVIREVRYRQAMRYVAHCFLAGEVVFSPIVYAHKMAVRYDLPKDHEFWIRMNEFYMTLCESARVLMLREWDFSKGIMTHELPFLQALDKPVEFVKPGGDLL